MKKITGMLLNQKNIQMKMVVNIESIDKNGNDSRYMWQSEYNKNTSFNIDSKPYITLSIKTKKDEVWTKYKSIMLLTSNIYILLNSCKRIHREIYKDKLYYRTRNNVLSIYTDVAEEVKEYINLGLNQKVLLKPTISYNINEEPIEAVMVCFYNTENITHLNIDEFEELIYVLEKIDIFTYSQMLLNHYVLINNDSVSTPKKKLPQRNIFTTDTDTVSATGNINKENPFEGFN